MFIDGEPFWTAWCSLGAGRTLPGFIFEWPMFPSSGVTGRTDGRAWIHESPPAKSISSFRIVVDRFSCMSIICTAPFSAKQRQRINVNAQEDRKGRTKFNLHQRPPWFLQQFGNLFDMNIYRRICKAYPWQLIFNKMPAWSTFSASISWNMKGGD
jgi:hypothetical protein